MRSRAHTCRIARSSSLALMPGVLALGLIWMVLATGCGGGSSGDNVSISSPEQLRTVAAGGTLTLTATVTGATDKTVLWSVVEAAGGTITSSGTNTAVYQAPMTAGSYTVLAVAKADSVAKVDIPITVTASSTSGTVIAAIPGAGYHGIAVNPTTGRGYGATMSSSLKVFDLTTNSVLATITAGLSGNSIGVGVDPTRNRVYVAAGEAPGHVWVIDGATNTLIASVDAGSGPFRVAANPVTNKVYVSNQNGGLTVVNGATTTSSMVLPTVHGSGVAVNTVTNRVYMTDINNNQVDVVDGSTDTLITTVATGSLPRGVAVDETRNRIYVTNQFGHSITAIDGATNTVLDTVSAAGSPFDIAVDSGLNKIWFSTYEGTAAYVADGSSGVITSIPMPTGVKGIGLTLNPATHRVYLTDNSSGTVTVIDGS